MEFRYISDATEFTFLLDGNLLALSALFISIAVGIVAVIRYAPQFDKKTKRVYKGSVARPRGEQQDANN